MAKQVFTGQEVPHIFATRAQDSGRNSNGTLYFSGNTLFSYRDSFPIAMFYGDIALINADSYSVTTSKHQRWARQALRHVQTMDVPNLRELRDLITYKNEKRACEYIEIQLAAMDAHEAKLKKARSEWKINQYRADIAQLENACAFVWHSVLGKKSDWRKKAGATLTKARKEEKRARYERALFTLTQTILDNPALFVLESESAREILWRVERHVDHIFRADSLGALRGRDGVLQTATFSDAERVMGKKWADNYFATAQQLRKIAAPHEARARELRPIVESLDMAENAEKLEKWLSGESSYAPRFGRIVCRVVNDEVQTSAGARVPLRDALRVVDIAKQCRANGQGMARDTFATGNYRGIRVDESGNVTIGCHSLPWVTLVECVARFAPEIEMGE